MKKISRKEKLIICSFVIFCFVFSFKIVFAQLGHWDDTLITGANETNVYKTDLGSGGTATAIARYVGTLLYIAPFLGFMFMIRVVMAGYEWMTAAGNKEKIALAQKRIMNATIGIVIFATLYFFAYFFVTKFAGLTGYGI